MNGDTRLSKALDSHPDMLELIIGFNPHDFSRLRNARMRRFMSPRITLRRVAAMARIPESELLARVNRLAGTEMEATSEARALPSSPKEPPAWMDGLQESAIRWVDVTAEDDAGDDPLPRIMACWKALRPGEVMGIRHRWEPQPLYDVWEKVRLRYWARQAAPDLWQVFVHRPEAEKKREV